MTVNTIKHRAVPEAVPETVASLKDLAKLANYSLVDTLNRDPDATQNGIDYAPRQVFSGHYVPVMPTPIQAPEYIMHSAQFFDELGFDDNMATSPDFIRMFSGDVCELPEPMRKVGWATGYALSIFGSEYIQQCPFGTGNGYGDGRAMSVLEAVINGKRWEMQLKGGGRTPYCRGADGRAVLRSSIREFLAQEHMHALGVPTSRSLSLFVSKTETVNRPWYTQGSYSTNPDTYIAEAVAISTRVAPSFLRVGQLELFGRRARKNEHPDAMHELEMIVRHAVAREYSETIDESLSTPEQAVLLAQAFCERLTSLVANWIRVGFCQGNFNSDNCAVGGFTLDYGPFGFVDAFNSHYQSWTGGGDHFSFFNQTIAAQRNFNMLCTALKPLLSTHEQAQQQLDDIQTEFSTVMKTKMENMWATKLGLLVFNLDVFNELKDLMAQTPVDYTIFFRELSNIPDDIAPLKLSFYQRNDASPDTNAHSPIDQAWSLWLTKWHALINNECTNLGQSRAAISDKMKAVNPKYVLREWFMVPAYQQASKGDYALARELQTLMTQPYAEQSEEMEAKYYRLKPTEFFAVGGVSHLSCSS